MDEKQLSAMPFFAGLDKKACRVLAQQADEIDVPAGKVLAREGEFAYEFFIIRSGSAKVIHGEEQVGELGPDDFFGEIGILESERRMATVVAHTDMDLVVLTRSALRTLDREHPDVAKTLHDTIRERLAGDSQTA